MDSLHEIRQHWFQNTAVCSYQKKHKSNKTEFFLLKISGLISVDDQHCLKKKHNGPWRKKKERMGKFVPGADDSVPNAFR